MQIHLHGTDVIIISIIVLFLGRFITTKLTILDHFHIPHAVTGGLICSILVAVLYKFFDIQISFATHIRDVLLLVFFSTIGLSAKFKLLVAGGKSLVKLILISLVFLVLQDFIGVFLAKLYGTHPAYGLFGGSISFAGGHGTAIAWGDIAAQSGLSHAKDLGIACATFGLIAGGLMGGPIAEYLINKYKLSPDDDKNNYISEEKIPKPELTLYSVLGTLLILAVCVGLGDLVNRFLFNKGVLVPGFLTAMIVGIVITNISDFIKQPVHSEAVARVAGISLPLFLSMSLMSMELWTMAKNMGPLLLLLCIQIVVATAFTVFIVFKLLGKDYDASVISAGFVGLGLGATPVGIANMNAITIQYGDSPKAFLVIPLIGAFFIDIANSVVIKLFFGAQWVQP